MLLCILALDCSGTNSLNVLIMSYIMKAKWLKSCVVNRGIAVAFCLA